MARRWSMGFGAGLGILAIAVNALLPIHIVGDIVHAANHLRMMALEAEAPALASATSRPSPRPSRRHRYHHHHDGACLICSGLTAAVAATTLPPPIVMTAPSVLALARPTAAAVAVAGAATHTPYAPRAPPAAT